jgi:mycofactocin precursor
MAPEAPGADAPVITNEVAASTEADELLVEDVSIDGMCGVY